ncbi:hypothetical protein F5X98DRAFT_357897 [Xylaria grammica]|nr:hypothetical protein F5X98DRAFT_357897 [Xylaria grammica]
MDAIDGRYVDWLGDELVDATRWAPIPDGRESYFLRHRGVKLWRDAGLTFWDQI